MMKALAEFIMRGRLQAALIVIIGLPIISNAAIALVTLRRGAVEGSWLLIVAMLPPLLFWTVDLNSAPALVANVGLLVTVYWAALALRATARWITTLLVLILISIGTSVALFYGFPQVPIELREEVHRFYQDLQESAAQSSGGTAQDFPALEPLKTNIMAAVLAHIIALGNLLTLVLARCWQALLYNPGGFQQEFLALRLSRQQSLLCLGLAAVCMLVPEWQQWSAIMLLPLVLTSIAMAHQFAQAQGLGRVWLVVFYLAMVMVSPFRLGMVLLSFADSWVDIRGKLISKKGLRKNNGNDHRD